MFSVLSKQQFEFDVVKEMNLLLYLLMAVTISTINLSLVQVGLNILRFFILVLSSKIYFFKSATPIYYKATCTDNEQFKKYGHVEACEIRHIKRYVSVVNLRLKLFKPVSPQSVSI